MPREITYTKLKGDILRESEKAIQFRIDESDHPDLGGRTFWFPLSQINYVHRSHDGELEEIDVADWIIDTKIREE